MDVASGTLKAVASPPGFAPSIRTPAFGRTGEKNTMNPERQKGYSFSSVCQNR